MLTMYSTKAGELRSLNTKTMQRTLSVILMGSVYVAKHCAVVMSKKNRALEEKGLILFVSSTLSMDGDKGTLAYSASKGAINGLVMPMARDLGRYGIRVAAIAPSLSDTPFI